MWYMQKPSKHSKYCFTPTFNTLTLTLVCYWGQSWILFFVKVFWHFIATHISDPIFPQIFDSFWCPKGLAKNWEINTKCVRNVSILSPREVWVLVNSHGHQVSFPGLPLSADHSWSQFLVLRTKANIMIKCHRHHHNPGQRLLSAQFIASWCLRCLLVSACQCRWSDRIYLEAVKTISRTPVSGLVLFVP